MGRVVDCQARSFRSAVGRLAKYVLNKKMKISTMFLQFVLLVRDQLQVFGGCHVHLNFGH